VLFEITESFNPALPHWRSSGGPGKGMYTRLYRRVLNSYGFVDSASCFNSFYLDSGIEY
jgi:hypothetical protein